MKEKPSISDHYQYGKRLIKHKAYIIGPGRQMGVPFGTLLRHDMSKFRPSEWKPYVKYWYGPQGVLGTNNPKTTAEFRRAAQKHYERNPHHAYRLGLAQKRKNELESVADWYSSSKASSENAKKFPTFGSWVQQNPNVKRKLLGLNVDVEKLAAEDKATQVFKKLTR